MQYMEEDIQNSSPTVMFRGTPCSKTVDQLSCFVGHPVVKRRLIKKGNDNQNYSWKQKKKYFENAKKRRKREEMEEI